MGNTSESLGRIARVKGCSPREARALCTQIQRHCKVSPPFSAIAAAIERHKGSVVTIKTLAEEACWPHVSGPSKVATARDMVAASPAPTPREKPQSVYEEDVEVDVFRPAIDSLTKTISRLIVGRLIVGQVEGKVIGFNGNGPYDEADLERLAMRLGATPYDVEIDRAKLDWIVIGHADFDNSYIQQAAGVEGIEFFTQEEFLGRLLLGDSPISSAYAEVQRASHAGMNLVRALLGGNELLRPPAAEFSIPSGAVSPSVRPVPAPTGQPEAATQRSNLPTTISSGPPAAPIAATTKSPHSFSHANLAPGPSAAPKGFPVLSSPPPGSITRPTTPASKPSTPVPEGRNSFREPPRKAPAPAISGDFRWPDVTSAPAQEWTQAEPIDLRQESDLKKLGYSVAQGVSIHKRRKVLDYGVSSLGLRRVAEHLAWLVLFHRNTPSKHDAVENWRSDLEWLRSRYRQGR